MKLLRYLLLSICTSIYAFESFSQCLPSTSKAYLDINNVRAAVMGNGNLWFDGNYGIFTIPKDTIYHLNPGIFFAGGIRMGGLRDTDNALWVSAITYGSSGPISYWPGPIATNPPSVSAAECLAFNRHFKVELKEINDFLIKFQNGQILNQTDIADAIRLWPGRGNPYLNSIPAFSGINLNRALAPFVDVNNDGIYNPLVGDYPQIKGDQMIWWVMNDAGNIKVFTGSTPVAGNIEIQVSAYAFNTSNELNNSTVYDYKVINRGVDAFNNTFFGIWADADLGFPNDDRIGCDIRRGLGYVYNDNMVDGPESMIGYGYQPPIAGIKVIKGPIAAPNDSLDNNHNGIIDEPFETIKMSSFMYNNSGGDPIYGDPVTSLDFYRYLQGVFRNGDSLMNSIFPFQIPPVRFPYFFPGTSHLETPLPLPNTSHPAFNNNLTELAVGWAAGDRRFQIGMGPFTFSSGQVEDFTIATIYSRERKNTFNEEFEKFLIAADKVQCLLDGSCAQPLTLHAPNLSVVQEQQGIRLNWTPDTFLIRNAQNNLVSTSTENYLEQSNGITYAFQGYQVFQVSTAEFDLSQLDNPSASKLIAQYDLVDNIMTLSNAEITQVNGPTTPVIKVSGNNQGIQRTYLHTIDAFSNQMVDFTAPKHYVIVAYASAIPVSSTPRPYLRSQKNVKVVSYYPSVQNPFLSSNGPPIVRLFGSGGSGSSLSTTVSTTDSLIKSLGVQAKTYESGRGPIHVYKIPGGIALSAPFLLELTSSISYSQLSGSIAEGDTILCTGNLQSQGTDTTNLNLPLTAGKAIVIRNILGTQSGEGVLEIKMLNDHEGGTFVLPQGLSINGFIVKKISKPLTFAGPNCTATSNEFYLADFARIIRMDIGDTVYLSQRLSQSSHQVLTGLGLGFKINSVQPYALSDEESFKMFHAFTYSNLNATSGISAISGSFDNLGISSTQLSWDKLVKSNVVNNGWVPYRFAKAMNATNQFNSFNSAPQNIGTSRYSTVPFTAINNEEQQLEKVSRVGNFKVVFTSDTSLWTRAAVLQYRHRQNMPNQNRFRLLKSTELSKNKQFQTDSILNGSNLSRGMSWFPCYAIDMDRGIRVNMMFCEDRDLPNGNNLKWEPDTSAYGGNSFVYVLHSEYSPAFESILDSIDPVQNANSSAKYFEYLNRNVSWVGLFKSTQPTFTIPEEEFSLSAEVPFRSTGDGRLPTFYFDGALLPSGVSLSQSTAEIKMYPNPALDVVTIEMPGNSTNSFIEIIGLDGRKVFRTAVQQRLRMDIPIDNLNPGLYFVNIFTQEGMRYTRKLIKQ